MVENKKLAPVCTRTSMYPRYHLICISELMPLFGSVKPKPVNEANPMLLTGFRSIAPE